MTKKEEIVVSALPEFKYEDIDGRKVLQLDPASVGAWFENNFLTRAQMQPKAQQAQALLDNSLYSDIIVAVQHELQKLIVEKAHSMEEIQHYRTCMTVLMLIHTRVQMIADMKVEMPSAPGVLGAGPDIARMQD